MVVLSVVKSWLLAVAAVNVADSQSMKLKR